MTGRLARHQTEAQLQRAVIELAETVGWQVAHFRGVKVQTRDGIRHMTPVGAHGKGFPDLVLVRDRLVFAELKTERGTVSSEQRVWIDRLEAAGCEVYVWRPRHWDEIEVVLTRRPGGAPR